jgi:hypothetical protein
MDMSFSSVTIDHPFWYNWSLLLAVVFVFIGLPLARRNKYALLVCSLPVAWSVVATTLTLSNVLAAMPFVRRPGGRAIAAGVAESLYPLLVAASVVAILATAVTFTSRGSMSPRLSKAMELPPLLFMTAVALFDALVAANLLAGKYSQATLSVTRVVMWAALAVLVASVALVVLGARLGPMHGGTRQPFVVFALSNAGVALALLYAYRACWNAAMGS